MEHATQSGTQFLLNIGTPALPNGTVTTRDEGLYLKPIPPTHGIQFLGPVERASLKLSPLPQGSFQRDFSENYIASARNTPKTPVDLGRSVLPDHLHIIPKAFSPNLGPFGSGPPIQPLLSAQANFAETVDFSKFETPMLSLPSPDHRTSHLPFIIGPQTHVIPTYRPIPELPAAKYAPPSPHFWYQYSTFQPTWRCNVQGSSQGSRLRFKGEENDYNKKPKGCTRQPHATMQSAYLLDNYQDFQQPTMRRRGQILAHPPRQPSMHSQLRGPEVEEGQSATRPVQKACDYKVQHHHGLPAATLLGCHSGPEEGCRKVPYGTFQGMQGLSGSPTISQGKAVKQ
jgi:hypothetical protein